MKDRRSKRGVGTRSSGQHRRLSREEIRALALARTETTSIDIPLVGDSIDGGVDKVSRCPDSPTRVARRRRRWRRSRKSPFAGWSRALLTLGASALVVTGVRVVAIADDHAATDSNREITASEFTRRPYVGVGTGISRLEPERPTSALSIDDNRKYRPACHGRL